MELDNASSHESDPQPLDENPVDLDAEITAADVAESGEHGGASESGEAAQAVSTAEVGAAVASEGDEAVMNQDASELDDPKSIELSEEYTVRWSSLISTTNWEKGKIICQWREALMGSQSPAAAYSDEAWSRRVGGVTPQHVGRLRRVHERFGESYTSYEGIYWSHFLAALEWDDAEMWLEGAVQSQWSVSQMRRTRWESMGGNAADEPKENEVVAVSQDEDYTPVSEVEETTGFADSTRGVAEGPRPDGPDFGDEDQFDASGTTAVSDTDDDLPWDPESSGGSEESPFAKLPSLPVDVSEALEQFKLAIIRHRADSWGEVSKDDVLKALEALRNFTMLS